MNVLDHVAAFVNARQGRAKTKIAVSQKAMLGIARPHGHRARVSFLDFHVHVGQRGIKRARVGVRNNTVAGLRIAWTPSGEEDHDLFVRRVPKPRRVGG